MTTAPNSVQTDVLERLLPCPFCGVHVGETLGGYIGHPNIPTKCPAQHILIRPGSSEEIAAWNTRAPVAQKDGA